MNIDYGKIEPIKYKILNELIGSNTFYDCIYDDTRWSNFSIYALRIKRIIQFSSY